MTETLRTKDQLLAELADNQQQLIKPEDLRDMVVSVLGVGNADDDSGTLPAGGSGLIRLGNKRFEVDVNGDGAYVFIAQGDASIDLDAAVFVAIVVNDDDATPHYILKRRMTVAGENFVIIVDLHDVVEGDIIELKFQVQGGATLSNIKYFFFGTRVG
jgi:hypothetical protein